MTASARRWLHVAGGLLGLCGVAFVAVRLHAAAGQVDPARLSAGQWLALALLALVSAFGPLALGMGWAALLRHLGLPTRQAWALQTYARSQLARYVPGNVFQFASRQALGLGAGLPGAPLAASVLWELATLASVGALLSAGALPLLWPALPAPLALAAALLGLGVLALLARRRSAHLLRAVLWHATFLTGSALISTLVLLLVAASPLPAQLFALVCAAQVAAWLVGLLTPGAPAGIGVREVVLLALLQGRVPQADLLLGIVLARMVAVAGDVACFAAASLPRTSLDAAP